MKTLSDITPQFIRGHYCTSTYFDDAKEISVFTFDSPKYYICTGIKKPLLCTTISIVRHWEGSVTVRLFGPEEKDGFRREESCTCTKLFYDKRIVSLRDLYINLRTFVFLTSRHFVLMEPTNKPSVEVRNTERFLNG